MRRPTAPRTMHGRLVAVLALYWAYDRLVGIDNVKLGG